jgi:hypothetical protein
MEQIKFRCSKLGDLMTNPKLKADKEAGLLSQTAKSYIKELWLYNKFGYQEPLLTPAILKGRLLEQDAFSLVQEVLGGEYRETYRNVLKKKGLKYLENDFITGTPDLVLNEEDYVEDTKVCQNLDTFSNVELTTNYEMQLQGYMCLTGRRKARLIYCLLKTPEQFIKSQKTKYYYMFDGQDDNTDYIEISKQLEHNNNIINEIPKELRIKIFTIDYDQEKINLLYSKIEQARIYYSQIKL